MRFLFVVHKNEEKAEQNSVLFHRLTLKERGLRPNGYFPLMRQPHNSTRKEANWLPSYMSGYKDDAKPFWKYDASGKKVGDYAYIKEVLGF